MKERFLHYLTLAKFQEDLNDPEKGITKDKIAFIKQERLIWTHDVFYSDRNDIILRISLVENDLEAEITRATNKERYLLELINNISTVSPTSGDGTKHVFLTQEEYDSLEEYEENTIYFILENQNWTFGDTFPVKLS